MTELVSPADFAASLRYDERGLLPVVVQDVASGALLMVGFADQEAVVATLRTGKAHFWSRSRQERWRKGETSGNDLDVVEVRTDCDRDTLLVRADPRGPTCHLGTRSCFEPNPAAFELGWLADIVRARAEEPIPHGRAGTSYTARLLERGLPRIAQKVGEEAIETTIAALIEDTADEGGRARFVGEVADLLYHLVVLLQAKGVAPGEVAVQLRERHVQRVKAPASISTATPEVKVP
jgi:phosphoribosyl-ATP pyrophosphohydrolase/phosphoribosyl-AMP cyclohydrolase